MQLVDTHAHLDQDEFAPDRADVVARAHAAGVSAIIAIGTTAASSAAAVELAQQFPGVWAAVGIQPNYCAQAEPGDWDRVVALARSPKVVAIGETGLDRYWDYTPFAVQQDYFDRHLRLARKLDLPFVVHMRECSRDILEMLQAARRRDELRGGDLRGVMHSFTLDAQDNNTENAASEPLDMLAQCLELGLYISFAGMATYKKSQALREAARRVPLDRLLVETDSPYLSPEPVRGIKRNEPAHVVHTATALATARGDSLAEFAAATTANARALFRFER